MRVQGALPDEGSDVDRRDGFQWVACPACGRAHFVDPKSGQTLTKPRAD